MLFIQSCDLQIKNFALDSQFYNMKFDFLLIIHKDLYIWLIYRFLFSLQAQSAHLQMIRTLLVQASILVKAPLISKHIISNKICLGFSNSKKLQQILSKITVQNNQDKTVNILQANVIAAQHIDPQTKKVSLMLNLTKDYRRLKSLLKKNLQQGGFAEIDINLAPKAQQQKFTKKKNLSQIRKIIAVSSCKGGVGKSTVAINIAATLKNKGFKVGIFDSDIYGPSLPTLINKEGEQLRPSEQNPKQIEPIMYEGMKCMSFGFVGSKPAAMRGIMVSKILSQLLYETRWGELDYLIVDMPPGTGDVQLSLCQEVKFDGAVIVSTPQRLAFIDVIKGIEMFQELRVSILGIVQNMAYYECRKCGTKDQIFGKGYTKMMMQQFGIENSIKLPLLSEVSKYSDLGIPLAFVLPEQHSLRKLYTQICDNAIKQVQKPVQKIYAYYNTGEKKIIVESQGKKKKIRPLTLRQLCKCAACIDEFSGVNLVKKQQLDPEVFPSKVQQKGNYAVAVVWSDGHRSSIYPYKRLLSKQIPEA